MPTLTAFMTDIDISARADALGTPLGLAQRGFSGRIRAIEVDGDHLGVSAAELSVCPHERHRR